MFGIIGAVIYGIAYSIGWFQEEQREHNNRQGSKKYGLSYYYDKKGKQRWTPNGRKRTAQEIHQERINKEKQTDTNAKKVLEQKLLNKFKERYDLCVIHKENISFEEYIAAYVQPFELEYNEFKRIKNSVSEERIKEIRENPIKYG